MGEITAEILTGYRCQSCAQIIDGKEPDHPRSCHDCEDDGLTTQHGEG